MFPYMTSCFKVAESVANAFVAAAKATLLPESLAVARAF
jgi:hypothetical protein